MRRIGFLLCLLTAAWLAACSSGGGGGGAGSFTLQADNPNPSVAQGQATQVLITVVAQGNFNGVVSLSIPQLPVGVITSFNPPAAAVGIPSAMTLQVDAAMAPGQYPLAIMGSAGASTQALSLTLNVTQSSPPPPPPPPPGSVDMTGTWRGSTTTQRWGTEDTTFEIASQVNNQFSGTLILNPGDFQTSLTGSVSGSTVTASGSFGLDGGGSVEYRYQGNVANNTYSGTITLAFSSGQQEQGTFSLTKGGSPPPPPPPPGGNGISGTVLAPPGGDVANTFVFACKGQNDCPGQTTIQTSGSSAPYAFENLPSGQYQLFALKDVNGNGQLDDGDYMGIYNCTSLEGCQPTPVSPPAQGIGIQLHVVGGSSGGNGAGVTFLRPADFQNGSVTLTFNDLKSSESVAVVPVYATQAPNPDAFSFSVSTQGVQTSLGPQSEPRSLTPQERLRLELSARHGERLEQGNRIVNALRESGVQPLASSSLAPQAYDKCPLPYSVNATQCSFWVIGNNNVQQQINATLRLESAKAYWFVQNEDTSDLSASELQSMAQIFEQTLLPSNTRYFGNTADIDNNGKVIILFSRLVAEGGALGYVYGVDFFPDAQTQPHGVRSNEADMLYMATPGSTAQFGLNREQFFAEVPGTLVHEHKHLIMFSVRILQGRQPEEAWWEEGAAMASMELAGYGTQLGITQPRATLALQRPQDFRLAYASRQSLTPEENFTMYGYNFLMLWRIAEKVGHDNFWKRWTAGPGIGLANLEAHAGQPFAELMLDFAATLLLDRREQAYSYSSLNLRDGSWHALGTRGLTTTSGSARSMAYYVGRGNGGSASVTLQTSHDAPYAVVVRSSASLSTTAYGDEPTWTVDGTSFDIAIDVDKVAWTRSWHAQLTAYLTR
jgi:hypothetical protein